MERYVIDFQAFKDDNNKYILKELAILSIDRTTIMHCLILSPYHFSQLSVEAQTAAKYLVKNHHKIKWTDGFITFRQALTMLKSMLNEYDELYVKGSERKTFIEQLLKIKTFNLDDFDCPKIKLLNEPSYQPECFYKRHSNKNANYSEICSLRYVYKLKSWFLRRQNALISKNKNNNYNINIARYDNDDDSDDNDDLY